MKKVIAFIVGGVLLVGGLIAYLFGIKKIGDEIDEF